MNTTITSRMIAGAGAPITIVAAGQSNMIGWTGANNGPFFDMAGVQIWDTVQGWRGTDAEPVNLSAREYAIYSVLSTPGTVGGGRNNPAVTFAWRLRRETGRPVRILFFASGYRSITSWIGLGRESEDFQAVNLALAAAGVGQVDYVLWQQGEADAAGASGAYTAALGTLRQQLRAERWWGADSVMLIGKPAQGWDQTAKRDYLNAEIEAFATLGHADVGVASSTGYLEDYHYPSVTGDTANLTGRSLFSMGYYNYFDAIPAWKIPVKPDRAALFATPPWPDGYYSRKTLGLEQVRSAHLTVASKYNLAPSIARDPKSGRFWVGWTANNTEASEHNGTYAKLVWSDDGLSTIKGNTVGGTGQGFTGGDATQSVAEPQLWFAPDGALWVFLFSSNDATQVFDGYAGVWVSVCHNPNATAPRFTKPFRLLDFGMTQPPQYFSGAWHLPVSYWRGGPSIPATAVPALAGQHFFRLDWVNVKATYAFTVGKYLGLDTDTFDEQCIVVPATGRLWASWRTLKGPYQATSAADGKTWSSGVAMTDLGSPRPSSKHRIQESPSGRLIAAWNDASGRTNLSVGIGGVGGSAVNTFTAVLQAGASAYPCIYADGTDIWVAYDNASRATMTGGGSGGKIRVGKVSEAALVAGSATVTTYVIDAGA